MPLTEKGEKIKSAMQEQYGKERGERVFYASENKGTIEGVHDAPAAPGAALAAIAAPGAAYGYGTDDADDYPVPKRRPDLLGTVCGPGGIKSAKQSKDQDLMTGGTTPAMTTAAPAPTTSSPMLTDSKDEKVSEKALKSATPPMNNLARPGNPGANNGSAVPYRGVQVGDSLHNQNVRNRAFWARGRTGRR